MYALDKQRFFGSLSDDMTKLIARENLFNGYLETSSKLQRYVTVFVDSPFMIYQIFKLHLKTKRAIRMLKKSYSEDLKRLNNADQRLKDDIHLKWEKKVINSVALIDFFVRATSKFKRFSLLRNEFSKISDFLIQVEATLRQSTYPSSFTSNFSQAELEDMAEKFNNHDMRDEDLDLYENVYL